MKLLGNNCLTVDRPLDFTLELNIKWRQVKQLRVTANLIMTVSTKMTSKFNEVERRNSKMLTNRVLVQPCAEQVDTEVDTSLDNFHCAHFNTPERQLRGTLHLLEDSSAESHLLSPPFTFAGLTIEVSRWPSSFVGACHKDSLVSPIIPSSTVPLASSDHLT